MGRGRPADLGQDPGSVGLGCRLDQTSGDHLLKGPITPDRLTQPQTPVGRTEGLDQPGRPARDDLRPPHRTTVTRLVTGSLAATVECWPQVQDLLTGQEPLTPQTHQRSQLSLVMGRPQVLHDPTHTMLLGHDLHGRGPRGCLDLAHKRAHTSAPYGLLVPHHQAPNTAIPTKTHTESPKTHQAVTSREPFLLVAFSDSFAHRCRRSPVFSGLSSGLSEEKCPRFVDDPYVTSSWQPRCC